MKDLRLKVHTAPFLGVNVSTPGIMRDVIYALLPCAVAGVWFFGLSALLVLLAATLGAALTDVAFSRQRWAALKDGSTLLTGLLVGLVLPPGLSLWMAFLGGVSAIGLGKLIWGGLGQNLFNPALVGRAFLQAAFPTAITTWAANAGPSGFMSLPASTFAAPLMRPSVDVMTTATPLGLMKFEQTSTPVMDLFMGSIGGSLGETSALLIILGGVYLTYKRALDWRIPVSILASVALLSTVIHFISPDRYPDALFMVFSGGILFGAVFMATDPVTSPITPKGSWIFGIGVGAIVVLIRLWGGLPEGTMYAILLMNAATPLVNRISQPKPFGRRAAQEAS